MIHLITHKKIEVGYLNILAKNLNKKESKALVWKLDSIAFCQLSKEKPPIKKKNVISTHSRTYYIEIVTNNNYCMVVRDDEQEVEYLISRFISEVEYFTMAEPKNEK